MKKLAGVLLVLVSCVSATSDFNPSNIYVDGSVGANTTWSSPAFNLDAGYMFNKYVGAELGWTYSSGYTYSSGPLSYSTSLNMIDIAAKGVLPISDAFNVFGKLGIAYNNYSGSYPTCSVCGTPTYAGSNLATLIGAGLEYDFTQKVSFHIEDDYIAGPNPNLVMLGVGYQFK